MAAVRRVTPAAHAAHKLIVLDFGARCDRRSSASFKKLMRHQANRRFPLGTRRNATRFPL